TSVSFSAVTPVFTSTHSAVPLLIRTTNVRSSVETTAEDGTIKVGCGRSTGQSTLLKVPGASRPLGFITSNSTGIVRVFSSTACEIRAIVPVNVRSGKDGTVNWTFVPSGIPAMYLSGTGTTNRNRASVSMRTIGSEATVPLAGPTSAPGWTFRSVTTPSNGARICRYPSISLTD